MRFYKTDAPYSAAARNREKNIIKIEYAYSK